MHSGGRGGSTALADLPVLVVDAQATGATPALGTLLEIGWTVARASEPYAPVRSHWLTLPPGTRVSRVVRELTGYRDGDANDALPPDEAWRALIADARSIRTTEAGETAPTVIHFERFETRFLRDWHERFGVEGDTGVDGGSFPFDVVCLHKIARRLYSALPRSGLRALAGFLGHSTSLERRAAGHVEASAHVWRTVVAELAARGIGTWAEVAAFASTPDTVRTKRVFPMPAEVKKALPLAPGVYRFMRSNGDVLYVGKAASIKKRVASHFTGAARNGERAMEMLTQALRVEVTVTPTVLEAALLECDEIKRLDPPYNVHLRERSAWFASRDLTSTDEQPSADHPLGPLPSRYAVGALGAARLLLRGEDATPLLRARAVGAPIAFTPAEDVFREGWSLFAAKHLALPARSPEQALARASMRLRELFQDGALEESAEDAPPGWDAPRVMRHLERSILSAGVLLRRARWLVVLSDATVAFSERARSRVIEFRGGEIVDLRDELGVPARTERKPWRERQRLFDGARYDRLRVVTTELRRVIAEGGQVEAHLDGGGRVTTPALARSLAFA